MKIIFCTGNPNKIVPIYNSLLLKVPEFQGEPLEISREKCRMAYQLLQQPVIVEDTSLGFNALKGLPGPYIKWFLAKLQPIGLYNMLQAYEDKTAFAMTIFSYCDEKIDTPISFDGRTDGEIVIPRGQTFFGWDPIFQPNGCSKTYAEMTKEQKNEVSHRRKAADKIAEYLKAFLKS